VKLYELLSLSDFVILNLPHTSFANELINIERLKLNNQILLPHVGTYTYESINEMNIKASKNVKNY